MEVSRSERSPTRVLLVTTTAYPVVKAGTEVYVHHLASELKQFGFEPIVLTLSALNASPHLGYAIRSVASREDLINEIHCTGARIVHFHSIDNAGFSLDDVIAVKHAGFIVVATFHLANNTCVSGDLWQFRKQLCTGKMDARVCTTCYLERKTGSLSLAGAFTILQRLTAGVFANKSTLIPGMSLAKINRHQALVFQALASLDHIICIAKWYESVLLANEIDATKISLIPQLKPENSAETLPRTAFKKLVFVGRLVAEKGIHELLFAWRNSNTENLQLTLVGPCTDDSIRSSLEALVQLSGNVVYKGEMDHAMVLDELLKHDVLVLGSHAEMAPLVVSESLARGLAIIGADAPGILEMCQKGLHRTYPRGNHHQLSELLNALNQNLPVFQPPKLPFDNIDRIQLARHHAAVYSGLIQSSISNLQDVSSKR